VCRLGIGIGIGKWELDFSYSSFAFLPFGLSWVSIACIEFTFRLLAFSVINITSSLLNVTVTGLLMNRNKGKDGRGRGKLKLRIRIPHVGYES
jgi:hypothetical protein